MLDSPCLRDVLFTVFQIGVPMAGAVVLSYLYERGGFALAGCYIAHMGQVFNTTICSWLPEGLPRNWWGSYGFTVAAAIELVVWAVIIFSLLRSRKRLPRTA